MKHLFRSIATTTLLGVATAAHANCWRDRDIEQTLNEVIAMHFPGTDAPDIIACDGGHFGPNVGGDYNSGRRQIRINIANLEIANQHIAGFCDTFHETTRMLK